MTNINALVVDNNMLDNLFSDARHQYTRDTNTKDKYITI